MPILSGHSHPRNLCILPRRIFYALVEQVQQERIFYPFVCTPEAWEVEEPEGLQAFNHLMSAGSRFGEPTNKAHFEQNSRSGGTLST